MASWLSRSASIQTRRVRPVPRVRSRTLPVHAMVGVRMDSRHRAAYIDSITLRELRTFRKTPVDFVHPPSSSWNSARAAKSNLPPLVNALQSQALAERISMRSTGPRIPVRQAGVDTRLRTVRAVPRRSRTR